LKTVSYKYERETPTGPYTWVRDSYHKNRYTGVYSPVHTSYSYNSVEPGNPISIPSSFLTYYATVFAIATESMTAAGRIPSSFITGKNWDGVNYAILLKSKLPSNYDTSKGFIVDPQYYQFFTTVKTNRVTVSYTWDQFVTWNKIGSTTYDTWTWT